jgi:hypothetical protein
VGVPDVVPDVALMLFHDDIRTAHMTEAIGYRKSEGMGLRAA